MTKIWDEETQTEACTQADTAAAQRVADLATKHPNAAVPLAAFGRVFDFVLRMDARNRERNARIADLHARVQALEARPSAKDAGTWAHGTKYERGDIVTFKGSGWICRETHFSVGAGPDHSKFRLFVKAGRDGKDAVSS